LNPVSEFAYMMQGVTNHCSPFVQVIQGGNYDVDLTLKSPRGTTLYHERKKQYDSYEWTADEHGEYQFCFSNEFSTFTHKLVYFDLQVGDQEALRIGTVNPLTAMTQVCIY